MKNAFLMIVAIFSFSGCSAISNYIAQRDLDNLCVHTTQFPWRDYKGNPAEMVMAYSEQLKDKISSNIVAAALVAISAAEPKQKYALVAEAAKEVGSENYSCPALKAFYEGDVKALGLE